MTLKIDFVPNCISCAERRRSAGTTTPIKAVRCGDFFALLASVVSARQGPLSHSSHEWPSSESASSR